MFRLHSIGWKVLFYCYEDAQAFRRNLATQGIACFISIVKGPTP